MIEIAVDNRSGTEVDEAGAAELVRSVLAGEGIDSGELGLAFVTAEESRALKREHLGVDEATDALAFPIDGLEPLPDGLPRQLGDVVVCPHVVRSDWRGPLVHALLHLVGYEHGDEMEARERAYAEEARLSAASGAGGAGLRPAEDCAGEGRG